jgi:hypothetical protein
VVSQVHTNNFCSNEEVVSLKHLYPAKTLALPGEALWFPKPLVSTYDFKPEDGNIGS